MYVQQGMRKRSLQYAMCETGSLVCTAIYRDVDDNKKGATSVGTSSNKVESGVLGSLSHYYSGYARDQCGANGN